MTFNVNNNTVITTDRIVHLTTGSTGSRPASPVVGQLFFDTTLNKVIVWNGAVWREAITGGSSEIPAAWAWGDGGSGKLGNGDTINTSSPVTVVGGFTNWVQLSVGTAHVVALRANGQAWSWGYDNNGRLGSGVTGTKSSPVSVVGGFTDWEQVSAGQLHTAAIRAGQAWCWGGNGNGRLGDGNTSSSLSPVSVLGGFTDWIQISAVGAFTAAIRANGQAWAWGFNGLGRLGDGTTSDRSSPVSVVGGFTNWVQISAGGYHTAAIRAGQAWCWGSNANGRLGDGTSSNRSSPVSVVGGFTDWVQISAGNAHTAAIRANGQAWAWGSGANGRLGNGTTSSRSSPVSVVGGFTNWVQISAGNSTLAIRANGQAWGWGPNVSGSLGDGTQTSRQSPVSVVGGFTDWIQVSSSAVALGNPFSAAIRSQPRTQTVRPTNQRNTF